MTLIRINRVGTGGEEPEKVAVMELSDGVDIDPVGPPGAYVITGPSGEPATTLDLEPGYEIAEAEPEPEPDSGFHYSPKTTEPGVIKYYQHESGDSSPNFDNVFATVIHSRNDVARLTAIERDHDFVTGDGPPATHQGDESYEGAVYLARDHFMTAIGESGYGLISLTPRGTVDISDTLDNGDPVIISIDCSTSRGSTREWLSFTLTTVEDYLIAPVRAVPDLAGLPKNAVHFYQTRTYDARWDCRTVVEHDEEQLTFQGQYTTPVTYSVDGRRQRLTHAIVIHNAVASLWIDGEMQVAAPMPDQLFAGQLLVNIVVHSYNPGKGDVHLFEQVDGGEDELVLHRRGGRAGTFHWDQLHINRNFTPFEHIKPQFVMDSDGNPNANGLRQRAFVTGSNGIGIMTLDRMTPDDSYWMKFHCNLSTDQPEVPVEVSFDMGRNWSEATRPSQVLEGPGFGAGRVISYMVKLPTETQTVMVRGSVPWNGGVVKDWEAWSIPVD